MEKDLLQQSISKFQYELFNAIQTGTYNHTRYENGQKAKEALIRSQTLIFNLHESVKTSFNSRLKSSTTFNWSVHPPLGRTNPELKLYGKIKGKDQDLVFLRSPLKRTIIDSGPNEGLIDAVGLQATKTSIVIGVRSQMSSVDKNFDTLMERAFAETLNLRLRTAEISMGEVYLLPIEELDDKAMLQNKVAFNGRRVKIEKFIKTFDSFTGRKDLQLEDQYKYDASALVLVDFRQTPPKILFNSSDLKEYGYSTDICEIFNRICPENFDKRLLESYLRLQHLTDK